jgi:hypothetical protein
VGTGGFEPPKTNQQIYSLSHLATLVYPLFLFKKSRLPESNQRPTDYKSVALPAELKRLLMLFERTYPLKRDCKGNNTFELRKKIIKNKKFFGIIFEAKIISKFAAHWVGNYSLCL